MERAGGVKTGKVTEDFDLTGGQAAGEGSIGPVDGDDPFDEREVPGGAAAGTPLTGAGGAATAQAPAAARPEAPPAASDTAVAEYRDRLMRLQAEFDNYRKFMENQIATLRQRAGDSVICEVLDVLDNLERALEARGDGTAIREGIRMVAAQMHGLMAQWGVREIPAAGARFDPCLHDAVESVDGCGAAPGEIVKVFRKGYTLRSNVIRHARVAVASGSVPAGGGPADDGRTDGGMEAADVKTEGGDGGEGKPAEGTGVQGPSNDDREDGEGEEVNV